MTGKQKHKENGGGKKHEQLNPCKPCISQFNEHNWLKTKTNPIILSAL